MTEEITITAMTGGDNTGGLSVMKALKSGDGENVKVGVKVND